MRVIGLFLLLVAFAGGGFAAGVVLGGDDDSGAIAPRPVLGKSGDEKAAAEGLGFPAFATKNTIRVGGADAIADAAAVAQAVYPSRAEDSRPPAVVLVDADDPQGALSAAQLMAPPVRAPILFAQGGKLPEATRTALERLKPTGAQSVADAQVIRVGDVPKPDGLDTTDVRRGTGPELAARIDALFTGAARRPSRAVVVASTDAPEYAMPAAAWAAKSGDPLLWVTRDTIPAATRRAIIDHRRPSVYVLGPEDAVSKRVLESLEDLSPEVRRISGKDPVTSAIAFSRFSDGSFGWNVVDPGHGMVFANQERVLDAAAAAPLSSTAQYGPLFLLPDARTLPKALQDNLLDIQPGYDKDPVRGVYNHGWLMGDETAVSVDVQARLDTLLEIQPVSTGSP